MPDLPITFIKGDKVGSETDYRDYLPTNMTAVLKPLFGADGYMLQQPGLKLFGEGVGVDRGALWNERLINHYRISGNRFISVDDAGEVTELGQITGTKTASLPYSFNTQAIITDGKMWLYNPDSGLAIVTDGDLGNPIDGVWIDGYYFLTDGEFIYHTELTDESAIDPLKFATAEFSPDPTLGVAKTSDNKVIVFGRYTTEYFINVAQANFAFQRVPTRAIKIGIVSTHAKAEMSDGFYIMGGRKEENISIHVLGVGTSSKVATREVDKIIGKYNESELQDVVLEARVEDGYHYLLVHLPDHTLIFNETVARAQGTQSAWSILTSDFKCCDSSNYRAIHGVFDPRLGQWLYGDKLSSNIGLLDETISTHYGEKVPWNMLTPFIYLENRSITKLEIEKVAGFSNSKDNKVFVSLTYNGVTSEMEHYVNYGDTYDSRFILRRLGYVKDWFAIKLRGLSDNRVAFSRGFIKYV